MSEEQGVAGEAGADPIALGAAISHASPTVDTALVSYLDDQRHHIHEQLKQIHLDLLEKWLGVLLRLATLAFGLAVAGCAGWLVREASRADGLRVESFSVPPDLAANGLTGQVVASRVIDRLSELQAQTNTGRPARTYSNSWGDKVIRLEIPETGISLEELDSWLRAKLGHETTLTGEVVRSGGDVILTARTAEGAVSVKGPEADMDALTARLAENIYRLTQPYRYAIYLFRHESRPADAAVIFQDLALNGGPQERRWSYNMWAQATQIATRDPDLGLRLFQKAHEADPDAIQPISTLSSSLGRFGRLEESLQIRRERWAWEQKNDPASAGAAQPDPASYADRLAAATDQVRKGLPGLSKSVALGSLSGIQIAVHDISAARANFADIKPDVELGPLALINAELELGIATEDWHRVLAHTGEIAAFVRANPRIRHAVLASQIPRIALAQAQLGDFAAAERTIAPTPGDCYPCLVTRAQIAERAGQRTRADWWFTKAAAAGPSLPFADEVWGRVLVGRRQPDAAIAHFTIASQRSPHFADPLEGWGEALIAKNQSHLALAKFAEAEKYAPNWGRLHLKWGEALVYAGNRDEAKKQFARAAALDLTPSERAALTKLRTAMSEVKRRVP